MKNLDFEKRLIDLGVLNSKGTWYKSSLSVLDKNPDMVSELLERTPNLGEERTLQERVLTILYGVSDAGTCAQCGVEIPIRIKNKNIVKYCGTSCSNSDPFKKIKVKNSKHHNQRSRAFSVPESLNLVDDENWLSRQLLDKSPDQVAEYLGVSESLILEKIESHQIPDRIGNASKAQSEVGSFISSFYDCEMYFGSKAIIPPQEIDIYLPVHELGIEYNGNYWHSEQRGKDKNYHLNKSRACASKGIRLIHVFEHDWFLNRPKVENLIRNALGGCTPVNSDQCTVCEVSTAEAGSFFKSHHLLNTTRFSKAYALFLDGSMVSVIGVGRSATLKGERGAYEIKRFCDASGFTVHGGLTKLINHFISDFNNAVRKITCYSNLNYGISDSVLLGSGFTELKVGRPTYSYVHKSDYLKLYNRVDFQKHKLAEKLATFDEHKTEYQNMKANGYDRIWDCGTSVYVYTR